MMIKGVNPRLARVGLLAGLALSVALPALAQAPDWPTRPVRVLVIASAGGPTDLVARLVSDGLSRRSSQRFVVENRTGAGGNIAASAVAQSKDGHTLLFTNTSHSVNRALYARLDYDPVKDLTPISIVAESPMVLMVPPNSPYRTVQDLVARGRTERLRYASAGNGGALQLVSLLFLHAAGIRMEEVAYRGSAPAVLDLAAGRIDMLYDAGITGFASVQGGQARALAVSAAQRSPVMPEVPTIAEAGFPAATFSVWQVLMAPSAMPEATQQALQAQLAAVLAEEATQSQLRTLGVDRIVGNTPEEARRYVAREMLRWEGILKEAGIEPQ
ncbi:tripartite tricarboxylate transporter substrate binding protein [Roseomonas sp. SSH11]|uniref:Tripartite tricarboxylate transporter substrate binding protein n=1 Tax=Pararoseomonas baculiformis TaxID=2820812 RepID=A0ABS4ADJ0_9PROT|nr:tripartite tricarboxylate transporter substrate-binding protein [Pararoseomonas baculiformis]MBP0445082.1 tripartite tricarboxylate transporter substrate binding protein [Pararoseomonas baculiformis]